MLQYFRNHHHSMVTYIGLKKKTCKITFKTSHNCLGFILFDMADLNKFAFTANLTTRNRWIVMQGFVIFIIVLRLNKRWVQILSCNDRFYSLWHSTYLSHYCAFLIPFASVGPDLLSVVKHFLNRWRRCFFFFKWFSSLCCKEAPWRRAHWRALFRMPSLCYKSFIYLRWNITDKNRLE